MLKADKDFLMQIAISINNNYFEILKKHLKFALSYTKPHPHVPFFRHGKVE